MAVERVASTQVRQGDVLLTPQQNINGDALQNLLRDGRNLLQEGEAVLATGLGGGHPHKVVGTHIFFVETNNPAVLRQQPDDQVSRVLHVGEEGATLEHDEHESIELPANSTYVVFRQLETLVGDANDIGSPTGVIANDKNRTQREARESRRYVQD